MDGSCGGGLEDEFFFEVFLLCSGEFVVIFGGFVKGCAPLFTLEVLFFSVSSFFEPFFSPA